MPIRRAVLMTRHAISPRLAIRIFWNTLSPTGISIALESFLGPSETRVNPSRSSTISFPAVPRRISLALFRLHIENGAAVTLAMAVVVVGTGILFGRSVAALATTGALYASIVDQPWPLSIKWRIFLLDIAGASAVTLLASLAGSSPWLLGPLIAIVSAGTALLSAYGRRALGLGVAAVLALLFGMATHAASLNLQLVHTAIFAGGGTAYAVVALLLALLLDDRTRQLYLGEAMLSFARYIAAKAELYNTHVKARDALSGLVEAHADLVERQQAARDMIFAGRRTPARTRWIAALIALLDGF